MSINKRYGVGVIMTLFGCAGMAEAVTERGSFMISAIVFAIGFALILDDYVGNRKKRRRR